MIKQYSIIVQGRVQGVGFRYSAREMAGKYSVYGYVRNRPDGSVYIEAAGEEASLGLFVDWCRRGPARSIVDQCHINEMPLSGYKEFIIR
jgi:acylphosphatase